MPITIRPATEADQDTIVRLIRAAEINPMDLKWPHFVLAVDEASGQVVGTGQIKQHGDKSYELASIATVPEYQRQGIAGQVIHHLLAQHPGVLYLTCMETLEHYYERFGFRTIGPKEMTPYFRRLMRVASAFMFFDRQHRLLVMKRDGGPSHP